MIQTLQVSNWHGIEILQVLQALDPKLREIAWENLLNHEICEFARKNGLRAIIVDGLWFRKFLGHIAVEHDFLSEMRRTYPPITDKDLIFIKNYER